MQTAIYKARLFFGAAVVVAAFASCNKQFEDIAPLTPSTGVQPTGTSTINDIINNDTTYSYFKALVAKAGAGAPTASLGNPALRFTAFIPTNAAIRASNPAFSSAANFAGAFSATAAASVVNYLITPQLLPADSIPTRFPNLQAPTLLNPSIGTPAFSPLVSLSIFPSRRGTTAWVNNIPIVNANVAASNGFIHNPALLVAPPSATLWSRISADADMTYFKAAVTRGDSGAVGTARFDSLLNLAIGPNFTVFVPTDASFRAVLVAQITQGLIPIITQQLIASGLTPAQAAAQAPALAQAQATTLAATPAVFSNPTLYPVLTAQVVKALVVYHILGAGAFTVNLPAVGTFVPTLLNTAVPTHPGVRVQASFTGPVVTAASVQGAANTSASNILINPTPNPGGTSDQFFTNGVLHKIDQVLRPQ